MKLAGFCVGCVVLVGCVGVEGQEQAGAVTASGLEFPSDPACRIDILAPFGTVAADADPTAYGVQTTITARIGEDCADLAVTATCDKNPTVDGVVPASGDIGFDLTVCAIDACDAVVPCTIELTDGFGNLVTASVDVDVDTDAPALAIELVEPADIACGDFLTPSDDIDPMTAGSQVRVNGRAGAGATWWFEVIDDAGWVTSYTPDAQGDAVVTLPAGWSSLVARADDAGDLTSTEACELHYSRIQE